MGNEAIPSGRCLMSFLCWADHPVLQPSFRRNRYGDQVPCPRHPLQSRQLPLADRPEAGLRSGVRLLQGSPLSGLVGLMSLS